MESGIQGTTAAVWLAILTLFTGTAVAAVPRGYTARPCGFDMNRNGVIGEAADAHVGDGVTADPDGDGVNEDILYVDGDTGSDTTGDGSAARPYKTVQKALNRCDGPGDGAEDIICIAGTFQEELTLTQSGVAGYYIRDNFQFPDNPTMLIGWDTDADGEYPPYDTDDVAVIDGDVDGNLLKLAIANYENRKSYIEIAHLTVQNYGYFGDGAHGAIQFCGSGTISHFYVHDVEFRAINKGIPFKGSVIAWSFWCGNFTHMGMINVLLDEFASFAVRGAPGGTSGHYRWQNLTMNFYAADGASASGWKLWGEHSDVEILDSVINGCPNDWEYGNGGSGPGAIAVCQCSQDWVIRNNEFNDLARAVTLQGDAGASACQTRTVDDILIDRNIIRNTVDWQYRPHPIYIRGGGLTTATTEDVTITNNFISSTDGWDAGRLRFDQSDDLVVLNTVHKDSDVLRFRREVGVTADRIELTCQFRLFPYKNTPEKTRLSYTFRIPYERLKNTSYKALEGRAYGPRVVEGKFGETHPDGRISEYVRYVAFIFSLGMVFWHLIASTFFANSRATFSMFSVFMPFVLLRSIVV